MPTENKKLKLDIGTIIAVAALLLSMFSAYLQFFWKSHDLKGSLVRLNSQDKKLLGNLLLVNRGNQAEVVLSARFIFSSNLHAGGGALSKESVGPMVLKPGDAVLEHISTDQSSLIEALESEGVKDPENGRVQVGVEFEVVDPSGNIRSNIYKFTELEVSGGELGGAKPGPWADREPIQLLYGGSVDD